MSSRSNSDRAPLPNDIDGNDRYVGEPGASLRGAHAYERECLREECDTVFVVTGNNDPNVLHIPDGDTPLCGWHGVTRSDRIVEKPVVTYPPGWSPWCKYCVAVWRRQGCQNQEGER